MRNAQSINTYFTGYLQGTFQNWGIEHKTIRESNRGIENTYMLVDGVRILPRVGSTKLGRTVFILDKVLDSHVGTGVLFCMAMGDFDPSNILLTDADDLKNNVEDKLFAFRDLGRVENISSDIPQGHSFYFDRLVELGSRSLLEIFHHA